MSFWSLVAETMLNPFGEDDDDFEVNWLIDRNISVSLQIVDQIGSTFPVLTKDLFWDLNSHGVPQGLPYTKEAEKYKTETHIVKLFSFAFPSLTNYSDKNHLKSLIML
jgi:hypothetical protein